MDDFNFTLHAIESKHYQYICSIILGCLRAFAVDARPTSTVKGVGRWPSTLFLRREDKISMALVPTSPFHIHHLSIQSLREQRNMLIRPWHGMAWNSLSIVVCGDYAWPKAACIFCSMVLRIVKRNLCTQSLLAGHPL